VSDLALVTGGAGFLGSHLCDRLLADGYRVLCLDNFATGARENVAHLDGNEAFDIVSHDITKPFIPDEQPAVVFHMASPASPPAYHRLPVETLEVGSVGTKNALEIARHAGARFLFTSTSEIYGDPDISPQPETYNGNVSCTGPRSVYDEAKRYGEALVMTYRRLYGTETRIVRIFNTYGPRLQEDDGRAISNFIKQALSGTPLTVYGDGSQTRSFCYVSDQIDGIVKLASSDYADPVNIGNPDERTILDIARIIQRMTGTSAALEFHPLPQDDPMQRCPDIMRARQVLGWEPKVPLEEGVAQTIRWFQDAGPATTAA
jgi:dTDP-glucose 4,6-dehydratase